MRQAAQDGWDAKFTIYSRDEEKQVQAYRRFPDAHYVLGDICDTERLTLAMVGHDFVIHAAALKYIPEGEFNAAECVRVNVDGARSVVLAARAAGVQRVVGISTDKASQPVNIYGMTKAVMERLFAEASDQTSTIFTTCRYGNVIGSTGSVVPVMIRQWHDEHKVKITDPYMTRYWMPISDAVRTVVAAFQADPGVTTVPWPKAAYMHTVAYAVLGVVGEEMYSPSGNDFDGDPRVEIIGARPGEKLHEDLVSQYEMIRMRVRGDFMDILPPGNEKFNHENLAINSHGAPTVLRETLRDWINESLAV
jgi:FlaA1/EpsC-like NDP-sugar epimerase